jgi:hypothetical protein
MELLKGHKIRGSHSDKRLSQILPSIFDAFAQESPISLMMRGLMERVFSSEHLDEIFASHSKVQYQRELLFSTLVNLLSLVVCGIHPSVNAAYKAKAKQMNGTRGALWNPFDILKGGCEPFHHESDEAELNLDRGIRQRSLKVLHQNFAAFHPGI